MNGWHLRSENRGSTLESVGFVVKDVSYVQAGYFDIPLNATDAKAKEICVVCEK